MLSPDYDELRRTFQVIQSPTNIFPHSTGRMIILAIPSEKSMASVVRLLLQPSLWVCVLLAATPLSSIIDVPEVDDFQRTELEQEELPWYASSPGHTVFGEYVGAHWSPPLHEQCLSLTR